MMGIDEAMGIWKHENQYPPAADDTSIQARRSATVIALGAEVTALRAEVNRIDRDRAYYADQLMAITTGLAPLCAHGGESNCHESGCPIHGETFVARVRGLDAVVSAARDMVGPGAIDSPVLAAVALRRAVDVLDGVS